MKNNIPYNNKALTKWSAFAVDHNPEYVETSKTSERPYVLKQMKLVDLVKHPGYEKFKPRFNWLYNNYNENNYQVVWKELQDYNECRKAYCFQVHAIAKAERKFAQSIEDAKEHFGQIPEWINNLTDNQRKLLLDRAQTCYGLSPEYYMAELDTKQVYTVPDRYVKDYNEYGEPYYYSSQELSKSNTVLENYKDLAGRVTVVVEAIKKIAEDAVIRDARWMSQFNNTEYDLRECREVEGDIYSNRMVPIADMQGPDSPYGLNVELVDFLEPIYEDEEN